MNFVFVAFWGTTCCCPGMSFFRTWKPFLWNAVIRKEVPCVPVSSGGQESNFSKWRQLYPPPRPTTTLASILQNFSMSSPQGLKILLPLLQWSWVQFLSLLSVGLTLIAIISRKSFLLFWTHVRGNASFMPGGDSEWGITRLEVEWGAGLGQWFQRLRYFQRTACKFWKTYLRYQETVKFWYLFWGIHSV